MLGFIVNLLSIETALPLALLVHHLWVEVESHDNVNVPRSLNGIKDMVGYRMTLNLSYDTVGRDDNSSRSCNFEDDVETSSILVRKKRSEQHH